ncbi:phosphoribosylaminoimidazole-succinocarboxamide synthase [Pelosinus fermentans]|uniref:phosphoribosylaminoimidazolesuccinocarboxamide synthase n=1 Tax=Pelosinus fermentans TaxID=365349 RepID=UPI0002684F8D|nr:phosphoribosylaminoimidazolesuccinocarboxamide synthase [Pelosinus fermentans]OAM96296.1 Phosphoribosylaminoimidazolesuccinocarboxamide synthase [Pelosinus fermentans DSM 17108]SDR38554.1 phosphoribosylaminoimidazole-succinocarboxamide synthase [Pelosinus fermentans]
MKLVFAGKSKVIHQNGDDYIMRFLDNVTAQGGNKTARVFGTGIVRAAISEKIFHVLEDNGIATHLISRVEPDAFKIHKLEMFKLEVIPRNYAAGSACIRFPFVRGQKFDPAVIKIDMKYGDDPMLNTDYMLALGLASKEEITEIYELAHRVNDVLKTFFEQKGLTLVDYKFEVGKKANDQIVIGDEISCDGMRVWDNLSNKSLDKDVFRYDWGNLLDSYIELCNRLLAPVELKKEDLINVKHD